MAKNFGRMHYEPVTIPAVPMFQTEKQIAAGEPEGIAMPARTFLKQVTADGTPWWEISKNIPVKDGQWFIAVNDDGFIMMAEKDPTMVSLENCDIWRIEHPGPDTAIRAHKWTGEEVEAFPGMEEA